MQLDQENENEMKNWEWKCSLLHPLLILVLVIKWKTQEYSKVIIKGVIKKKSKSFIASATSTNEIIKSGFFNFIKKDKNFITYQTVWFIYLFSQCTLLSFRSGKKIKY